MLRQIEWRLQNGPITKSGVLPVTALFFWKICSSFRTSEKELIWCTNDANVHIRIFRKRWSLILGCFFPVSILKENFDIFADFIFENFNNSVFYLIFPTPMKNAIITSVYKKRTKTSKDNYRPVSILSKISKIYERLMFEQISAQPAFTCSKLTIETLEQGCEICSKLTIKTP